MTFQTRQAMNLAIGKRIKAARKARRLSQTALGESVGVTFQQVQKYENGANRVSAALLVDLRAALGVSLDYFYQDIEAIVVDEPEFIRECNDIMLAIHRMPDAQREHVSAIVQAINVRCKLPTA